MLSMNELLHHWKIFRQCPKTRNALFIFLFGLMLASILFNFFIRKGCFIFF